MTPSMCGRCPWPRRRNWANSVLHTARRTMKSIRCSPPVQGSACGARAHSGTPRTHGQQEVAETMVCGLFFRDADQRPGKVPTMSEPLSEIWKEPEVAQAFVTQRARLLPQREEQLAIMLRVLRG